MYYHWWYLWWFGGRPALLLAGQHAPELLPVDDPVLVVVLLLQHLLNTSHSSQVGTEKIKSLHSSSESAALVEAFSKVGISPSDEFIITTGGHRLMEEIWGLKAGIGCSIITGGHRDKQWVNSVHQDRE